MKNNKQSRAGFTLMEVMIATSITSLVLVAVLGTFIWCGKQSITCTKMAWSQREAMITQMKLLTFIRNASRITDIDEETGQWVTLGFADGTSCDLVYSNAIPLVRDGRMYLFRGTTEDLLVARGLTEIMESGGFTTPVFIGTAGGDSLRIAYRVSEPTSQGTKSSDDDAFAVSVRFSAALRNTDG